MPTYYIFVYIMILNLAARRARDSRVNHKAYQMASPNMIRDAACAGPKWYKSSDPSWV